jgi:2-phosphosulfolactate phosphatase
MASVGIHLDLVSNPPYTLPSVVVDVFYASAVGWLLHGGAKEVWVCQNAKAALAFAEGKILLGEQENLPLEGFHSGISVHALGNLKNDLLGPLGKSFVVLAPLAQTLETQPPGSILAYFRNARSATAHAAKNNIHTLIASPIDRLEPSLANAVTAGFIAKRLQQLTKAPHLSEGAQMAITLLKSFPDPQEALFQSGLGQHLFKSGRQEDIALASLISTEDTVPILSQVHTLKATMHGLSKDQSLFCFEKALP